MDLLGLFFIGVPVSVVVLYVIIKNLDSNYKDNNDNGPPDDNC
tara:strand:- start:997 stop:1125 length:129 start_codon:yes stop_codon:yes gene_type:complete